MARRQETVVFVVNVAVPSDEKLYNDYLKNAKDLMKHMMQKMMFTKPASEVGIILIGVKNPDHVDGPLCIQQYQDIHTVSWKMIEDVEGIESNEGICTKWIHGLKAAVNIINEAEGGNTWKCQIILISNFPAHSSLAFKNFDSLVEQFKDNLINFLCCGIKILKDVEKNKLNHNEETMLEFCSQVDGRYDTIDYVLSEARFYEQGRTKFCPWKANLEMYDIKIPVRVVVRVSKNDMKKSWSLVSVTTEDGQRRDTPLPIVRKKHLVDRNKIVHEKKDTLKGYMCGKKFVPVTDVDEEGMKLSQNNKSLKMYGVTKAENVSFTYRNGPTTWLVFPQEDFDGPFLYLLLAMKSLNQVGFVRKIYQDGSANPMMCTLTPCTDEPDLPWCFIMHQLIFAEEEAIVNLNPVESEPTEASKEELDAIGDLIKSMWVKNDGQDQNSTKKYVRAPERQHLWNVKAARALHPEEPLSPPEAYLMTLLEPPDSLDMAKVKYYSKRIMEMFQLTPGEIGQPLNNAADMEVDEAENKQKEQDTKEGKMERKEDDSDDRECIDFDDHDDDDDDFGI